MQNKNKDIFGIKVQTSHLEILLESAFFITIPFSDSNRSKISEQKQEFWMLIRTLNILLDSYQHRKTMGEKLFL